MTTTTATITVTVHPDATGSVTLPTSGEHTVTGATLDDARDQLLDLAVEEAAATGHALHVEARDPDATYHLIVHPDGTIDAEQPQAAPRPQQPTAAPPGTRDGLLAAHRRRKRLIAGVTMTAIAVGSIGGLAIALSRPAPAHTLSETAAADAEAPTAAEPAAPAAEPAAAVPVTDPADPAWPVVKDPNAGPTRWTATTASGFSHNQRGAAWAAANLAARIDPYMGPAIYKPVLASATGNVDQVAALIDGAYKAAAAKAGITDGSPLLPPHTPPMLAYAGWAIPNGDCTGSTCRVRLAADAGGQRLAATIPLSWRNGDWRLHLAHTDRIFDPAEPAGSQQFRPFTVPGK